MVATKKEAPTEDTEAMTHQDILKNLEPLSKVLKTGAGSLWKIFVVRYRAKGAGELLAAIVISIISIRLLGLTTLWLFVPAAAVVWLLFDGLQLLIAAQYFAMDDIVEEIKQYNQSTGTKMEIYNR